MKYNIYFSREFDEEFRKLDKNIKVIILKRIRKLEEDPYIGKPLKYELKGIRS